MISEPLNVQVNPDDAEFDAPMYTLDSEWSEEQEIDKELEALLRGEPIYGRVETDPHSIEGYGLTIVLTPPDDDGKNMMWDWDYGMYTLPSLDIEPGQQINFENTSLMPPFKMKCFGTLADRGDAINWDIPHMYHLDWLYSMRRKVAIKEEREMEKELEVELQHLPRLEW